MIRGMAKLEGDTVGVHEAVEALRAALRRGDAEEAQRHRWLAPRPPGERDLLADLAAAEGIGSAIHRLAGFWQTAELQIERIRPVNDLEAELYERLALPSESLPIVTVVRRDSVSEPWKVVCTTEAYDERFLLWLPTTLERLDDGLLVNLLDRDTQLLMDGSEGVLARGRWLVNVRGPAPVESWPENLPGQTERIVELATALSPEPRDRREQLRWLLGSAAALVGELGGYALYLPLERRVLIPGAVQSVLSGEAAPEQAARFWARVADEGGYAHTDGLRLLGLPEIEIEQSILEDQPLTRGLLWWLVQKFVQAEQTPALGTEVSVGDVSLMLLPGRRGPRRGRSYGRWGAVSLNKIEGRVSGSRSRLRAPDDLVDRS